MSQPESDTRKRKRDKHVAEPTPAADKATSNPPAPEAKSEGTSSRKRKGKDQGQAASEPAEPAAVAPEKPASKKASKAAPSAALVAAAAAAAAAEPEEQEVELVEDEEPAAASKKKKQKKDPKAQENKSKEPVQDKEKPKEASKEKEKANGKSDSKEEDAPSASEAAADDAPKSKKQKKAKKNKDAVAVPPPVAAPAASSSSGPVIAIIPGPVNNSNNSDAKAEVADGDKKKAGKFSVKEKEVLKKALDDYVALHNLGEGGLEMLFSKRRPAIVRGAWNEIAAALPNRTTQAVYHFCSHTFAPKVEGKWAEAETERLRTLVTTHGRMWSKIGAALGRLPGACRDKWRLIEKEYKTGRWTVEEDRKLTDLVSEVCPGEQPPREGVHWTVISERMGNRSHSACRNRWYNTLYLNLMRVEVWTKEDDIQLVQSVADQQAEDLSEVRWNLVSAKFPTNPARARFKNLMSRVPNYATLSLSEVTARLLEQLKAQKAADDE